MPPSAWSRNRAWPGCRSPAAASRSRSRSAAGPEIRPSGPRTSRCWPGSRGTHAYQHDSRTSAFSQVRACGQARGIPVTIFTALEMRTQPSGAGPVPLAIAPGGGVTTVPGGQLPAGWRWVTDLDGEPAAAAPGREVT